MNNPLAKNLKLRFGRGAKANWGLLAEKELLVDSGLSNRGLPIVVGKPAGWRGGSGDEKLDIPKTAQKPLYLSV